MMRTNDMARRFIDSELRFDQMQQRHIILTNVQPALYWRMSLVEFENRLSRALHRTVIHQVITIRAVKYGP